MLQRMEQARAASPITELLDRSVAAYGGKTALNFLGRCWTYAQLGDLVDRAAAGLQRLGVVPGTRVGLCLPNTPYFVIFYFAVLKAGGIVVNFSPLYVERELKHQIRDSGTTIMVVPDLRIIHSRVAAVAEEAGSRRSSSAPSPAFSPRSRGCCSTCSSARTRRSTTRRTAGTSR